jgi:protein tyrosine/serine phosphatase
VETGEFYRAGQMADHRLGRFVTAHDIQTVVNLRGESPGTEWYENERAVCAALDVSHYDLDWSMKRLPSPESLAALVGILDTAEGPILVHCHGGTHRAAIASATYRLLNGESIDDARDEIGVFFNDAPIGELLDLYEEDGGDFRTWVIKRYPAVYEEVNR